MRNDYFGELTHFGHSAAQKSKSKGTPTRGNSMGKKDKKVMELKATMKMYHEELTDAVSHFRVNQTNRYFRMQLLMKNVIDGTTQSCLKLYQNKKLPIGLISNFIMTHWL